MTITLPLPPQNQDRLEAVARAKGVSTEALVREAVEKILADAPPIPANKPPTRSLPGILAEYGPAPSEEEIDQNRAGMFANLARSDF